MAVYSYIHYYSSVYNIVTDNVVRIIIKNFEQMSSDGTCHYLNPDTIEVS